MDDYQPNYPQPEKKNRNIWLLTCGITAGVVLMIGLCIMFVLGIVTVVFGTLKSSTPYQEALAAAQSNNAAIEALGEPIEAGWLLSGSIETGVNSGVASLQIPVSGPKGSGTIYVDAEKLDGEWYYNTLTLEVDGRDTPIRLSGTGR